MVKPTLGKTNAHQLRWKLIRPNAPRHATTEMEKNQNARHHMKTDMNVAMILTTCWVIAGSPKYVMLAGKSLARPMMAKEVNAGGPVLVSG